MESAFIIWYCVVALVSAIVLAQIIIAIAQHRHSQYHHRKMIHIIQMSNEREMLYVPGDNLNMDGIDNDYNSDEM